MLTLTMDQALDIIKAKSKAMSSWVDVFRDPAVTDADRRKLLRNIMRDPADCPLTPAEYAAFKLLSREPTKQLSVAVPMPWAEQLTKLAEAKGISVAALARKAIGRYLMLQDLNT